MYICTGSVRPKHNLAETEKPLFGFAISRNKNPISAAN